MIFTRTALLILAFACTACASGKSVAPTPTPPEPTAKQVAPSTPSQPASCSLSTELASLAPLLGTWRGEGWVMTRSGSREPFVHTEDVRCAVGGQAVLIEGLGRAAQQKEGEGDGKPVHQALAVISHDPASATFQMRAYSFGRPKVDSELAPDTATGELVWGFPVGTQTRIRFRIHVTDDTWREIGEVSHQSSPWRKFLEMNLHRVTSTP